MYLADRWWQRLRRCAILKSLFRPGSASFGKAAGGTMMTVMKIVGLTFAAVLWLAFARPAKASEGGFLDRVYKDRDGKEAKYVLFVPHDYKGDKAYPLILFLHGAGEREGGKKAPVE